MNVTQHFHNGYLQFKFMCTFLVWWYEPTPYLGPPGPFEQRKVYQFSVKCNSLSPEIILMAKYYISIDFRPSVQTSSNWSGLFLCAWQIWIAWLVISFVIWTSTRKVGSFRFEWTITTERGMYIIIRKQTLMFRTWIGLQMCKLTKIVTSLCCVIDIKSNLNEIHILELLKLLNNISLE